MSAKNLPIRKAAARGVTLLAAIGVAIMLSGCVVVPADGYHHHYWW